MNNRVYQSDNLSVLQSLPDGSVDLIYIDPPFNTGRIQARTQMGLALDIAAKTKVNLS